MTEAGYVELPVISWLSGHGSTKSGDNGLGWMYRDENAMAEFERPLEDPLVEKLLISAIIRINPDVKTEAHAKFAVAALRKTMANLNKLIANRRRLARSHRAGAAGAGQLDRRIRRGAGAGNARRAGHPPSAGARRSGAAAGGAVQHLGPVSGGHQIPAPAAAIAGTGARRMAGGAAGYFGRRDLRRLAAARPRDPAGRTDIERDQAADHRAHRLALAR